MIDPVLVHMHMGVLVVLRSMREIVEREGVVSKSKLTEYTEMYLEKLRNDYDIEIYDSLESILE